MRNEDRLKRCRIHDLRKIEISLNNGQCRLAQNRIVIINLQEWAISLSFY